MTHETDDTDPRYHAEMREALANSLANTLATYPELPATLGTYRRRKPTALGVAPPYVSASLGPGGAVTLTWEGDPEPHKLWDPHAWLKHYLPALRQLGFELDAFTREPPEALPDGDYCTRPDRD